MVGVDKAAAGLPQPGERLAGKYLLVRVLGEGGMGVVYEASHERLRQRVAIKVLLPDLLRKHDLLARFEREARAAGQLRSRHVARVVDVDKTPEGLPYIVMEYLEGHDLETELEQRGALPIAEAVGYVLQACAAMEEAHEAGVIHRDLKPSNLFLCPERDARVVKVLDFGISKMADEDEARLTGTHATVGTPLYMSPEQVRSSRSVDARSDIWSLGVILYELLAGRPPFTGSTTAAAAAIVADPVTPLRELRSEVPLELDRAILRALEKEASHRFPSVRAFANAIAAFAEPLASLPPVAGSGVRSGPHPRLGAEAAGLANARTLAYESAPAQEVAPFVPASTSSAAGTGRLRTALVAAAVALLFGAAFVAVGRSRSTTAAPEGSSSAAASTVGPAPSDTGGAALGATPPSTASAAASPSQPDLPVPPPGASAPMASPAASVPAPPKRQRHPKPPAPQQPPSPSAAASVNPSVL